MDGVSRSGRGLVATGAALGAAWLTASLLVVPPLIESAARGEGLALLGELLASPPEGAREDLLRSWQALSQRVLALLLVFCAIPLPLLAAARPAPALPESERPGAARFPATALCSTLALGALTLLVAVFLFHPVGYVHFIAEDHWAEYGTFVSLAMAACFLGLALVHHPEARRPGILALALGAGFVAMEEISWGQRILGLDSPDLFAENNLQGELNLHNLFPVVGAQYALAGAGALVWGVLLPPLALRWRWLRAACTRLGIPRVPAYLRPFFALAAVVLWSRNWLLSGEAGELCLGVALAALAFDLTLRLRRGAHPRRIRPRAAWGALALALGTLASLLVLVFGGPAPLRAKLNEFASLRLPEVGRERDAERLFEHLARHPELTTPRTRIEHGKLLFALGRRESAARVLEAALADLHPSERSGAGNAAWLEAGEVLTLLGRAAEAESAFAAALARDRALLAAAPDPDAAARARWSLARTLLARGDGEGAREEASRALALGAERRTRFLIARWRDQLPGPR